MRCLSRQGHSSFVDKCISVRQSLSVDACRGAERVAVLDMNAEDFQSLSDEEKFACCSTQVANISDRSLACSFHTARINAATTFCGNAYHMHTSVRLSHWYGIGFTSGCWYGKHDLRQFVFVFCLSSVPIPRRMKRKCAVASCPPGLRMTNLRVLCTMDELVMGCRVDRERHICSRLFAFCVCDVFHRPRLGCRGLKSRLL